MSKTNSAFLMLSERLRVVMSEGGSLDGSQEKKLWNSNNFEALWGMLDSNPKEDKRSFIDKLIEQLKDSNASEDVMILMLEILVIYYAYPTNITNQKKLEIIKELSDGVEGVKYELPEVAERAFKEGGVGSGGMGINTNRQKEIFYLIEFFNQWFKQDENTRVNLLKLDKKAKLEEMFTNVSDGRSPQSRHLLLFYIHPNYYHPIISSGQKKSIVKTFDGYLTGADASASIDEKLHVISEKLLEKLGEIGDSHGSTSIFYNDNIEPFWNSKAESSMPNLDVELSMYKKQVVLYGPPGTGKTYSANTLAKEMIRYDLTKKLGIKILDPSGRKALTKALDENIHSLQLHPAYSYEDFVRGLQIKNGNTSYEKGYLLKLIDKMKSDPENLPNILILDEINRVDLSRLFGETFSALENRGKKIDLIGGDGEVLCMPENLYIIGTMNLIDHSVEQIDFALRRRFLWVEANYNSEALFEICQEQWEENPVVSWDKVTNDFSRLIEAADSLNKKIEDEPELGSDFMLGHVFFLDVVAFLQLKLSSDPVNTQAYLFQKSGTWKEPIEKIWHLSLLPILNEYLSGLDQKSKKNLLGELKESFKPKLKTD